MFRQILAQSEDVGGLFKSKAITDANLTQAQESLAKLGLTLPDEYAQFLTQTDGLFWGGIEFFGSKTVMDKKNGYSITDLFAQNRLFQALNPGLDKVFLGRSDDENFLFDPKTGSYEIVDEFSGEQIKTFPLFEGLFSYIMGEQAELIQNYVGFNEDDIADEATDFES